MGHDIWRKYAILFDGLAVSPKNLVPWIERTVGGMARQQDSGAAQLNLFMKDGNGNSMIPYNIYIFRLHVVRFLISNVFFFHYSYERRFTVRNCDPMD